MDEWNGGTNKQPLREGQDRGAVAYQNGHLYNKKGKAERKGMNICPDE